MKPFKLDKKTGFTNLGKKLTILDENRRYFYGSELVALPIDTFNLPEGIYFLKEGKIARLNEPVHYNLSVLPKPERKYKPPLDFKILFANNPNKATINWMEKSIVFDNSFKLKPRYQLAFVLYHEYGHHLYNTEKYADLFASNLMKKMGYNPSQIGFGMVNSLSSVNVNRKKYIVDKLLNAQ